MRETENHIVFAGKGDLLTRATETPQERIGRAIAERGYKTKHATAHVVKAYLKMLEEACEIAQWLPLPPYLEETVERAGKLARAEFDAVVATGDDYNPEINTNMIELAALELADVQVTVMDMANGLSRLLGGYDVVQVAVEKATKDIGRGRQ